MNKEPIDLNSPLGISKREWTKVLGANLALLVLVYVVAIVCTLCGSDIFLLRFFNERLNEIEGFLKPLDLLWVVKIPIAAIEAVIYCAYATKKKPNLLWFFIYCVAYYGICTAIYFTTKTVPGFMTMLLCFMLSFSFSVYYSAKDRSWIAFWKRMARLAIAFAISFVFNEAISFFRMKYCQIWQIEYSNSFYIALTIEYDLALALALGLLTLLIPWEKGGNGKWISRAASGSSPTSMRWSRKNSPKKNNLNLSPKAKKRLRLLKAKVIVIQTVALAVIAFVPIVSGRGIEFSLMYVAFCVTRMLLGFTHSPHFKSELSCVTIGALTFWAVTFLAPSATVSIIVSLVYGCALALGFRLYWELHDLMLYRKAAKTDRYAMFYTAFKGNTDPRHIRGVMRLRGFGDENDIKAVQMYMTKEKVDYIAEWLNEPQRSLDRRLTDIAEALYKNR